MIATENWQLYYLTRETCSAIKVTKQNSVASLRLVQGASPADYGKPSTVVGARSTMQINHSG